MDLKIKRELNAIAEEFNHNCKLEFVYKLISLVRLYKDELEANEIKEILSVPLNILNSDVELNVKLDDWIEKNSYYFAGNVVGDSEFTSKWRRIFESKEFDLDSLNEYGNDIINDIDKRGLINDFWLRNIEVTLRDDVKLKEDSCFKISGNVFANKIFDIIL